MLESILPKKGRIFFQTFNEIAVLIVDAAMEFQNMQKNLSEGKEFADKIKSFEIQADKHTRSIYELLHKTFITPFDREDIDALVSSLDDIIDNMEETSARIFLYEIKHSTPEMEKLTSLCYQAALAIKTAVFSLTDLKNSNKILNCCIEISKLESEADKINRQALTDLFRNESQVIHLIKMKEIYDYLEKTIDCCKDVGNILRNILLEYA